MKSLFVIAAVIISLSSFIYINTDKIKISFSEKNSNVRIDDFGNVYIIHHNEIIKYNSLGLLQKKFSTKRYGNIDFVDVTNPLKILVYYKDFQQLVFLDNQLSASSAVISLENLGYEQTSLICSSANNSFWLYDKQNNELLRFSSDIKPLVKTGNLKRILDIDLKPNYIKEHNGYLYLNSPNEGILVFDIYGTFTKTIPLKGLKEFDVVNNNIFYYQTGSLKEYQSQNFMTIEKQFNDTLLKTVYWQNNKFYKIYSDSLLIQ